MYKVISKCLALIVVMCTVNISAQQTNIRAQLHFRHLTMDDGLSNNHINSICQDRHGFMWFATLNGVNRYDGLNVTVYKHYPDDSTKILSNNIHVVFCDSRDSLWIGSVNGLNLYNKDLDHFVPFVHKDLPDTIGEVYDVVEDKDGKIWIGASSGLYAYNSESSALRHFTHKPGDSLSLPTNAIFRLMVDSFNRVWISCLESGICVFDQNIQAMTYYKHESDNEHSLSGNRIDRFYEDTWGNIWIGTFNHGLNLFHPKTSSFTRLIPDPSDNYSKRVRAIFEDNMGYLFIGTRVGLYLMDPDIII